MTKLLYYIAIPFTSIIFLISAFLSWLIYYNNVAIILAKMQNINVTIFLLGYKWNTNPFNVELLGELVWLLTIATIIILIKLFKYIRHGN